MEKHSKLLFTILIIIASFNNLLGSNNYLLADNEILFCPDLLTNGGFESGALSPWYSWEPSGTVSIVSSNTYEGNYAVRLQGGECSIEYSATGLSPNTTYYFSAYTYNTNSGDQVELGVKNYGGSQVTTAITQTSYEPDTVTFTTGVSNTSATLFFYAPPFSNGAYGDRFILEEASCNPTNEENCNTTFATVNASSNIATNGSLTINDVALVGAETWVYIGLYDANGDWLQDIADTGNPSNSYTVNNLGAGDYHYAVDKYIGANLHCHEETPFTIGETNLCISTFAVGTYYIDATNGDDMNDGLSPSTAWQSFCKANNSLFGAGTTFLLKCGETWNEQLKPISSGTSAAPNIISNYGTCNSDTNKPHIAADGQFQIPVHIYNIEYWEVNNLQISNNTPNATQYTGAHGIRVELNNFGIANHIYIRNCYIHDVDGNNIKGSSGANGLREGHGIIWQNGGTTVSTFNDLRIENNVMERIDRNAIKGGGYWDRTNWHPSTNVIIRGNELTDIGGDGIVVIGTDGALVEYNVLKYFRMRPPLSQRDCSAGIWSWSADSTLFQYNESAYGWGKDNWGCDAQGYDADANCVNTIFQYNYSHHNDGGFTLVINYEEDAPASVKLKDVVFRYNISVDDGAYKKRLIHMTGAYDECYFYNNIFYMSEGQDINVFLSETWPDGYTLGTSFYNNIFYLANGATANYSSTGMGNVDFGNNIFYGSGHNNLSSIIANPNTNDPLFLSPDVGTGINDLEGFKIMPNSPTIDAGMLITGFSGDDFWGNSVPKGVVTDIGVHEMPICGGENITINSAWVEQDEYAQNYIQTTGTVQINNNTTFIAGDSIILKPNFHVTAGADFHAYIETCALLNSTESRSKVVSFSIETELPSVKIYPNPSKDWVNVISSLPIDRFTLTDIYGRWYQPKQLFWKENNIQLDISNLPSGAYYLSLINKEGIIDTKKIVKATSR